MKEDSLSFKVYLEVRKKILSNQLVGGARLVESQWAEKLNVSRVAVREAFMRLAGENLVEFGEKGGSFVKKMTTNDVHEIRELRELLEVGALKLIFEKRNEQLIHELEQLCKDFEIMVDKGYFGGACEADIRFHEKLIEGSGNQRLLSIYKNSNIPLFHMKLDSVLSDLDDYMLTKDEHAQILDGIKRNNYEQSFKALTAHLDRGEKEVLSLVFV
ncbi:GntR family transcriptional regulator [Sphingobacterium sp. LRF_L2]|uniref:GntR family transcriptional regulator n=1 Tax=Sphingobacterium sp. LRF_L2 TaxID=3369421 RepID=UPI003F5D6ED6